METKCCSLCKKDLPATSEFFASRKLITKTILQGICRGCQREYRKEHYQENRQKYVDKAKKYTQTCVKDFLTLKKTLTCEKCGESRWWVLDFHHINPEEKDFTIGTMSRVVSRKRLEEEIKKCKVLCANCHRDLHYKEKM